jgi:predicted TIM-barrel fold metal-dependent hydrolase
LTASGLEREVSAGGRERLGIVDCDVHNTLLVRTDLKRYLDPRWYPYYDQGSVHGGPVGGLTYTLPLAGGAFSLDAIPEDGQPGSDLELMREQLLDPYNIEKAVLQPFNDVHGLATYGELGAALAAAMNDWLRAEWLGRDERLFGAITVPFEDPARAEEEIERVAAEPRFVSVFVMTPTQLPLGHPRYLPIYEAAERHGLPVGLHVGGLGVTSGAAGWPAYFIEYHANYPQAFQAQVASLVHSGVFDRLPSLQFVLQETGISWLPALMWRLDRTWRAMRTHVPHLDRLPSEVLRDHFWLTTQPFDEPERDEFLPQFLDYLDMTDRIVFSSDYPHWDRDDPDRVLLPSIVGDDVRERILSTNARRLFGF